MDCLEENVEPNDKTTDTDDSILDGAAIVNMLRPIDATSFGVYAQKIFWPIVEKQLKSASRIDIVWKEKLFNLNKSHIHFMMTIIGHLDTKLAVWNCLYIENVIGEICAMKFFDH